MVSVSSRKKHYSEKSHLLHLRSPVCCPVVTAVLNGSLSSLEHLDQMTDQVSHNA